MGSSRALPPIEAPPIKRNTINQRRCRARRQIYIEDLERRLRAYETQGVQATAEVQAAARKVAEENHALREELKALREQNEALQRSLAERSRSATRKKDKVEGHLFADGRRRVGRHEARKSWVFDGKAFVQGASFTVLPPPPHQGHETHATPHSTKMSVSTTTVRSPSPPLLPLGSPPSTFESRSIGCSGDHVQREDISPPPVEEEDDTSVFIPSPPPSNLAASDPGDLASTPHTPFSPPSPSTSRFQSKSRLCQPVSTTNSTPCLEAALIIASMRGVPSNDITVETEILPELGCLGPLSRPKCISPEDCSAHSQLERKGIDGIGGDDESGADVDFPTCAVDNGRLFGILAREG